MAPRAAASRSDETAQRFLAAGAQLIDGAFLDADQRGRHPANAIKFPAAMDWLRIEDVLRLAARSGAGSASRKAYQNRWQDRDEFMRDAIIYALRYGDAPQRNPDLLVEPLIERISDPHELLNDAYAFSVAMFDRIVDNPRTYLVIHLTPTMGHYPEMQKAVQSYLDVQRQTWRVAFSTLIQRLDLRIADEWSVVTLDLALQAALDGFLICQRVRSGDAVADGLRTADLFARSVVAILTAALAI